MRHRWRLIGGLLFSLVSTASLQAISLDGPIVIGKNTIISGFIAWGKLYDQMVTSLQNLGDSPPPDTLRIIEQVRLFLAPLATSRSTDDPSKACASNLRVLLGATEMYNMDHKEMLHQLDISTLVTGQYLKIAPTCPSGGNYSSSGDLAEQGIIVCSRHGSVDNPIRDDQDQRPQPFPDSAAKLVAAFLDFHQRAVFRPRGGIWCSLDNDVQPQLILEASIKPKEFFEALKSRLAATPKPERLEKDLVRFHLPVSLMESRTLLVEIFPDGISARFDGPSLAGTTGPAADSWKEFLTQAGKPEVIYLFELDGQKLRDEFNRTSHEERLESCLGNLEMLQAAIEAFNQTSKDRLSSLDIQKLLNSKFLRFPPRCPNLGEYSWAGKPGGEGPVTCSVHGTVAAPQPGQSGPEEIGFLDSRWRSLSKLQIRGTKSEYTFLALGDTPQAKTELQTEFEKHVKSLESRTDPVAPGMPSVKDIVQLVGRPEVVVRGEWVGLSVSTPNPGAIFTNFLPKLPTPAGSDSPANPAAAKSPLEVCQGSMRVLTGAVEMYSMDHQKPLASLDIEVLASQKYLKNVPVCPEGGQYVLENPGPDCKVRCPVHGVLP